MSNTDGNVSKILATVKARKPLVHVIVGQVSVNDCANVVLAMGARPITSECPCEVAEITAAADALAVSFANINEMRAESIIISGKVAREGHIPSVIDVVGVTCSGYRRELAKKFISQCRPAIIKGNISEIKMMAELDEAENVSQEDSGLESSSISSKRNNVGIDSSPSDLKDLSDEEKLKELGALVREYAKREHAVVMASGVVDIVSDGDDVIYVTGGKPEMAQVTGTGCMLNCMVATLLSVADEAVEAAVGAARLMKRCGEKADVSKGLGSYRVNLIDEISKCGGEY